MIVFLSIDSAKMKRKQTSLTTFLAKKVCQGKVIYVYYCQHAEVMSQYIPSQSNSELMGGQVIMIVEMNA